MLCGWRHTGLMLWRPGSKPWVWSQAEQSYKSGPLEGWEIELERAQGSAGLGEGTSRAINCQESSSRMGAAGRTGGSGFGVRWVSRALYGGWSRDKRLESMCPVPFPVWDKWPCPCLSRRSHLFEQGCLLMVPGISGCTTAQPRPRLGYGDVCNQFPTQRYTSSS